MVKNDGLLARSSQLLVIRQIYGGLLIYVRAPFACQQEVSSLPA